MGHFSHDIRFNYKFMVAVTCSNKYVKIILYICYVTLDVIYNIILNYKVITSSITYKSMQAVHKIGVNTLNN